MSRHPTAVKQPKIVGSVGDLVKPVPCKCGAWRSVTAQPNAKLSEKHKLNVWDVHEKCESCGSGSMYCAVTQRPPLLPGEIFVAGPRERHKKKEIEDV